VLSNLSAGVLHALLQTDCQWLLCKHLLFTIIEPSAIVLVNKFYQFKTVDLLMVSFSVFFCKLVEWALIPIPGVPVGGNSSNPLNLLAGNYTVSVMDLKQLFWLFTSGKLLLIIPKPIVFCLHPLPM